MKKTKPSNRRAVLVSASVDKGQVRLSIDDVVSTPDGNASWAQRDHVTSKLISIHSLEAMEFADKELADLAFYILSRLSAIAGRGEL